jgi:hypothetical protein
MSALPIAIGVFYVEGELTPEAAAEVERLRGRPPRAGGRCPPLTCT